MRLIKYASLAVSLLALTAAAAAPLEALPRPALQVCAEALCVRREAVNTVVARLRVTLRDLEKNKSYLLHGAYLGDASGNLRLRITAESGQLLLDMSAHGERLDVSLPGKDRFLSGTREELLNHPQSELALLAQCGRARDLFFPSLPDATGVKGRRCPCLTFDGHAYYNVPDGPGFLPRYLRRISMNLNSMVVDSVAWFARGGIPAGRVLYADYRFSETDSAKPAYPGRVTLLPPGENFSLELDVEDLTLNSVIAPAKFDVPVPDGVKRELLLDALDKNVNLWND